MQGGEADVEIGCPSLEVVDQIPFASPEVLKRAFDNQKALSLSGSHVSSERGGCYNVEPFSYNQFLIRSEHNSFFADVCVVHVLQHGLEFRNVVLLFLVR